MNNDFLLIGLDGGATKISGWEIVKDPDNQVFSLGTLHAEKSYKEIPGYLPEFKPVDIKRQLEERDQERIMQTEDEIQQESVYVEACAQVVEQIVSSSGSRSIVLGLGMPGLKTENKRGIAVVANGPRMINYSDLLEKRLEMMNISMKHPVQHIGSDADYCGIGENFAAEGLFREVKNAYYLGGGTGVADAMKLKGELVPFDAAKEWIAKTWEMKNKEDKSLERFASAGGIQSIYSEHSGISVPALNQKQVFPLQMADLAAAGEKAALETFDRVAVNIADLLFERIVTLYAGWQKRFAFVNPNKPEPVTEHKYQGTLLERIIIGQRLGQLFDSANGARFLKKPVLQKLSERIEKDDHLKAEAKAHYNDVSALVFTSKLREAPAIGAGIDAYFSIQK